MHPNNWSIVTRAHVPRQVDTSADEAYCAALVDAEGNAKAAGVWAAVDNGGCGDRLRVVCSLDRHVGVSCEDVNECDILNGGCGDDEFYQCNNLYNAQPVFCADRNDPACGCADINECEADNGGCGDPAFWACKNQDGFAPSSSNPGCILQVRKTPSWPRSWANSSLL